MKGSQVNGLHWEKQKQKKLLQIISNYHDPSFAWPQFSVFGIQYNIQAIKPVLTVILHMFNNPKQQDYMGKSKE